MKHRRLVVIADTHCGHLAGLTPPDWWYSHETTNKDIMQTYDQQKAVWNRFSKKMKQYQPIDFLFHMGDAIDGKGQKSGGTEERTTDMNEQCQMAIKCIKEAHAKKIMMIYGTPYHTGVDQDMEDVVANELKCEIHGHSFIDINGVVFDLKHFIGSSSIPHGRWTSLASDKLWNTVWHNEHDLQPDSDVVIRAHVHYHVSMTESDQWMGLTCPALQGFGSKFGIRKCKNTVHVGFVVFDIDEKGNYSWHPELLRLELQKAPLLKW